MASDAIRVTGLPIVWRAALALVLALLAAHLLVTTQYYATIFFLALLILGLMLGVARLLLRGQSAAESQAVDRAIIRLQAEQKRAVQAYDHLQALINTVSAALLVVAEDGRVTATNRAAQLLLRGEGPRLSAITAIGARDRGRRDHGNE